VTAGGGGEGGWQAGAARRGRRARGGRGSRRRVRWLKQSRPASVEKGLLRVIVARERDVRTRHSWAPPRPWAPYTQAPAGEPSLFLQLEGIEHRSTRVRRHQSNGFIERCQRTLLDEHPRVKGRTTWYETLEELQVELDLYLESYNNQRPHRTGR
jgi:hypothetical protein